MQKQKQMKMRRVNAAIAVTAAIAALAVGSTAVAGALPQSERASVASVARAVTPGVVSITTDKGGAAKGRAMLEAPPMPDGPLAPPSAHDQMLGPQMRGPMPGPQTRAPNGPRFPGAPGGRGALPDMQGGSGVIVDAVQGYVLTNDHVVRGAKNIEVTTSDDRRFKARVIGGDQTTDIALLQINPDKLVAVPLGESSSLQVGDFVLAVGNPFGIGQSVSSGIVSALGRTGLGIEGYENFIQTDASINPGASGGALISLDGKLVGVNTALISKSGGNVGIGLAVPVDVARQIMDQLIVNGEVKRGRIGVVLKDARTRVSKDHPTSAVGAAIESVEPASPAERAGLAKGDVVVAANGAPINSSSRFRNLVGLLPVGSDVDLRYRRGDEILEAKVRVEAPVERKASTRSRRRTAEDWR
jgi:S1-C subfamily serine protease